MGLRQRRWLDVKLNIKEPVEPKHPALIELSGEEKLLSLDPDWLASNPCAWQRIKHIFCGKPAIGCYKDENGLRWYCTEHMQITRRMVTAVKRIRPEDLGL